MNVKAAVVISATIGAIVGSLMTLRLTQSAAPVAPTTQERIKDFYETETAVYVSPHTLRKRMDRGETNYTLVDVRSPQEYEKEHIVGAVNIPAYRDPNTSISLDAEKAERERIVSSFRALGSDTEIIVYCYSMPCMTGRKIGKLLADSSIYVKHLGVGWNEWRYYWNLWNHDGETPSDLKDYIATGKEPGKSKVKDTLTPCVQGELGC